MLDNSAKFYDHDRRMFDAL